MFILRQSTQIFLTLSLFGSGGFFISAASALPSRTPSTDTSTPQETRPGSIRATPNRQIQPNPNIETIPGQLSDGYYCCTSGGSCEQVNLLTVCDLKYHCYETENESVCEPE